MSRRTFPRAAAAGLIAATLGGPAAAQTPNPWRGETATVATAPAPRAVAPKPTRQVIIGIGFNSTAGLTGTIEIRELPRPTATPERCDAADRCVAAPAQTTITSVARPVFQPGGTGLTVMPMPTPRYLEYYPTYFPPAPVFPQPRELVGVTDPEAVTGRPTVVRATHVVTGRYMPPPAPLPVPVTTATAPRFAPTADVLIPVTARVVVPAQAVFQVWKPIATALPADKFLTKSSAPVAIPPAAR
jgi:hypothetical protein